jgi:hypothetical protein
MNSIYLVQRDSAIDNGATYDSNKAHVIVAASEYDARQFAADVPIGDENRAVWFARSTTATVLGVAAAGTEPGVILTDYIES